MSPSSDNLDLVIEPPGQRSPWLVYLAGICFGSWMALATGHCVWAWMEGSVVKLFAGVLLWVPLWIGSMVIITQGTQLVVLAALRAFRAPEKLYTGFVSYGVLLAVSIVAVLQAIRGTDCDLWLAILWFAELMALAVASLLNRTKVPAR